MKPELVSAERVFLNRSLFKEAERNYALRQTTLNVIESSSNTISDEVNKIKNQIRTHLNEALAEKPEETIKVSDLINRLNQAENENRELRSFLNKLDARLNALEAVQNNNIEVKVTVDSKQEAVKESQSKIKADAPSKQIESKQKTPEPQSEQKPVETKQVESKQKTPEPAPVVSLAAQSPTTETKSSKKKKKNKSASQQPQPTPAPAAPTPAKKEEDDFDLFEEEEETEEKRRIKEERLAAYASKKEKKPAVIAKSSVLLDVKVWDDETDLKELEEKVRSISIDGLVWGSSKLVPVAFNIKKLQIQCVIEDDKVSTEALEEQICAFEDHVQSVDIAAFNKI